MRKSIKYKITTLLLLTPFFLQADIKVKKNGYQFIVSGSVNDTLIKEYPGIAIHNIWGGVGQRKGQVVIGLNDTSYMTYIYMYCDENKSTFTTQINRILANGITLSRNTGYNQSNNTFFLSCQIAGQTESYRTYWSVFASINETNIQTSNTTCKITPANTEIDFGNIVKNSPGQIKTDNINISCDKDASVNLSIKNATNGIIPAGDAKIAAQFSNHQSSITAAVKQQIPASYPLELLVKDTGETTGLKSGHLILEARWD